MKIITVLTVLIFSYMGLAQEGQGCFFNNQVMPDGASVTAFQNSTVPFGNQCVSETRVCNNGVLTGSFAYANCSINGPAACLFNGQTIASGSTVTAFQNSTVPFGSQCVSQVETCTNGSFDGNYQFASCSVSGPAACIFNGQTIASGNTVTAYQNSTVPFGSQCVSKVETCNNGSFDGNYQFASCVVAAPAACMFNGQTVPSGATVTAYQNSTVPFGSHCVSQVETCTNGSFNGNYQFASCTVDSPAACIFNGQTVASGQSVVAYQTSSVPYGRTCVSENRTCTNGVLSGTDQFASCTVAAPAACIFNGQTIPSGGNITAYQNSTVPYGSKCVSQVETCANGVLSGNYQFASCAVSAPAACLFNGQSIASGQTVTTYANSTVPYGQACVPVIETCTNGTLNGNNKYSSCKIQGPASCVFDGQTIPDSHSVTAYKASSVPEGNKCVSQQRTCSNGILSGSYAFNSCTVDGGHPPPDGEGCWWDGHKVCEGEIVIAFKYPDAFDDDEDKKDENLFENHCLWNWQFRICHHGKLRGHYKYAHCSDHDDPDDGAYPHPHSSGK